MATSLAARFQIGDAKMIPFDLNMYSPVLAQAGDTAVELGGLVQAVEELIASPAEKQRVADAVGVADEIGADVAGLLNRVFLLSAGLIVVFLTALFLCRLASARLTRR